MSQVGISLCGEEGRGGRCGALSLGLCGAQEEGMKGGYDGPRLKSLLT